MNADMDRSRIYKMKNMKIEKSFVLFFKKNKVFIGFSFLFLVFYIIGCLVSKNLNIAQFDFVVNITKNFVKTRNESSFVQLLLNCFFTNIIPIIIIYISGFLPISSFLIIPSLLFKSIGLGVAFSLIFHLSENNNPTGLFYVLTVLIIPAFFTSIILIYFSVMASKMSRDVRVNYKIGNTPQNLHFKKKFYRIRFLFIIGFVFLTGIIESVLTLLFSSVFQLI